mmetsp:Transcript_25298/g.59217  ORF Transcript_25298/g.59217 Transcript_25298/m.59217 type:complete len:82 (-) Transcript_25298:182-427(-)
MASEYAHDIRSCTRRKMAAGKSSTTTLLLCLRQRLWTSANTFKLPFTPFGAEFSHPAFPENFDNFSRSCRLQSHQEHLLSS